MISRRRNRASWNSNVVTSSLWRTALTSIGGMVKSAIAGGCFQLHTSRLTAHNFLQPPSPAFVFILLLFCRLYVRVTWLIVRWIFLYGVTQGLDARNRKTTNCVVFFWQQQQQRLAQTIIPFISVIIASTAYYFFVVDAILYYYYY